MTLAAKLKDAEELNQRVAEELRKCKELLRHVNYALEGAEELAAISGFRYGGVLTLLENTKTLLDDIEL